LTTLELSTSISKTSSAVKSSVEAMAVAVATQRWRRDPVK